MIVTIFRYHGSMTSQVGVLKRWTGYLTWYWCGRTGSVISIDYRDHCPPNSRGIWPSHWSHSVVLVSFGLIGSLLERYTHIWLYLSRLEITIYPFGKIVSRLCSVMLDIARKELVQNCSTASSKRIRTTSWVMKSFIRQLKKEKRQVYLCNWSVLSMCESHSLRSMPFIG